MSEKQPPMHVKLGDTTMVLRGRMYWRPAGAWGVGWKWVDGVLLSHYPQMPWLHDVPLEEITQEEFMLENEAYL